jgi:hypothetical protein
MLSALDGDRELLALLRIGRADIEANRAGRLGPQQRRNQRRQARIFLASGVVLGGLFAAGGKMSASNGGQWFVPELIGVLIFGCCTVVAVSLFRSSAITVRCITGPASVQMASMGRAGNVLKLVVQGERCNLPRRLRSTDRRWRAALGDQPYHVYVVGKLPSVVGIEPA